MDTILLSESQSWIVLKALTFFASDQGEAHLRHEFPDLDFKSLEKDFEGILSQFEKTQS